MNRMLKNNPIHLLSISLDTSLFDQSSESFNRHLHYASFFKKLTILVLTSKKLKPVNENNLHILPLTGNPLAQIISSLFKVPKDIDLITAQDPLLAGLIGILLKKLNKVKLNIQIHGDFFSKGWLKQRPIHHLYFPIITRVLDSADSIRVVSEKLKKSIKNSSKVFVAPIRVDLSQFYKPAHYRAKNNRFIFVGRLAAEKNIPLLIEAFTQVIKLQPEVSLTIVGDGPERKNLEQKTKDIPQINLVGSKTLEEVVAVLHKHDIYIQTSLYEGWGRTYVEAFAAGLPIITTPVAAVGELLQPNQNCLIATSTDQLVASCLSLIEHPEEAYRLAKNGQMWVKQNLESTVLTKAWIDGLYKTLDNDIVNP